MESRIIVLEREVEGEDARIAEPELPIV